MKTTLECISAQLRRALGGPGRLRAMNTAGGGIHRGFRAHFTDRDLFIKINHRSAAPMFEAEFAGLQALRDHSAVRVPQPIVHGADGERAWLVMEFIELHARGDARALGEGLARLHRVRGTRHGWASDNFIGATPQPNGWHGDWAEFWWRCRLGHQLDLACAKGYSGGLADRVSSLRRALPALLRGHAPTPSLLHGDLWGGNHGYTRTGAPVIFDPACYFGDRETDLAMTELFGGFDPDFHAAYRSCYPLDEGYARRRGLYQLYHLLNHLNLFGTAWLGRTLEQIDAILRSRG